jgi:uncharacterized protein (DUF1778 family)
MAPKTGRPRATNPRNVDFKIRLTPEEKKMLDDCAKLHGLTRTDAILRGIKLLKASKE